MKFTLSWLKQHLNTEAPLEEIIDKLTMVGLEVEKIIDRSKNLENFIAAKVLDVKQHPNADKLKVCIVDTGSEKFQVVCGAPNVFNGLIGVFARSGSYIPGTGIHLKTATIRGIESNGMLLSENEMKLSDNHEGIVELPAQTEIGKAIVKVMDLNDPVIEIAITPNRGDCLGVRGIACDLAAAGLGTLNKESINPTVGTFTSTLNVNLDFNTSYANACPYFVGRFVRNVKNSPSPKWLKDKLSAIGLRPISALVDITNWLTFDRARPLHVFDAEKLNGDLHVRLAKKGETLMALDGKTYTLDDEMTIISDDCGPQALGGIMGGENSGITDQTTDIFIESAYFDPIRTARTGRKLNLQTDARFRFERGIDPTFLIGGIEIASKLISDVCGGQFSDLVIAGKEPNWNRDIYLRTEYVSSFGGIKISEKKIIQILTQLGCSIIKSKPQFIVSVPAWRPDIVNEACLVEEVLRINGYENIPPVSLKTEERLPTPPLSKMQRRRSRARRLLAARGIMEAVTYSFMSKNYADLFGGGTDSLCLENPISKDLSVMRPSILPNLILAAKRNSDRGITNVNFFEVGPQFNGSSPSDQSFVAAGIHFGFSGSRHWAEKIRKIDAFDSKADAVAVLAELNVNLDNLVTVCEAPNWYHPGRSGILKLGPQHTLAFFGEIHPGILAKMGINASISAFEIFIDTLPVSNKRTSSARPALQLSQLQPVERDFAFVVNSNIESAKIIRAVWGANEKLIKDVSIFDVFEGKTLRAQEKSVAINVVLQPTKNTLTDEEIDTIAQKIIKNVTAKTSAKLRS